MNNNFFNQLTLIKVYQFVFLSFNIFENVLARLSQHENNIRGHVGDFIILPRVAYKRHIDHYIKGKKKKKMDCGNTPDRRLGCTKCAHALSMTQQPTMKNRKINKIFQTTL